MDFVGSSLGLWNFENEITKYGSVVPAGSFNNAREGETRVLTERVCPRQVFRTVDDDLHYADGVSPQGRFPTEQQSVDIDGV